MSHPLFLSRRSWRLSLLFLFLVPLLFTACSDGEAVEPEAKTKNEDATAADSKPPASGAKDEDLVPVEVSALARGPIEATLRFSTNLEAEVEVQVFSQAARRVVELRVEEGDRVEKGEVLLRLEDEEQRSALARVESQLRKASRELGRQKNLYERELISEQAMNDATYELEQLELSRADAERELGYTEVKAPIRGVITRRLVDLGDTITVNQHLFDLVDFETIVARVYVPEKELPRLRLGQPARLVPSALRGAPSRGEVMRVAPVVDPQSGTVKVTVDVPTESRLLPGMYVEVELVTEVHEEALRVPKRAVVYDQGQAFLFRLTDKNTVERLRLEVALEDESWIEPEPAVTATASEVVPLEVGDRVVVAGQAGLKSGSRVRVLNRDSGPG